MNKSSQTEIAKRKKKHQLVEKEHHHLQRNDESSDKNPYNIIGDLVKFG